MKSSACAFVLLGAFALSAQCGEPLPIASFSSGSIDGWTFSEGKEFPGAQGNLAIVEDPDAPGGFAAYLEGAFGEGGGYVSMVKNLAEPLPFKGLSFKVKTADYEAVKIRLVDGSGQVHQQTLALKDSDAWQSVAVGKPVGKDYIVWGGAKDSKWHDPLKEVSLMLSRTSLKEGLKNGKAFFGEIKLAR
jgi:hypothetical protein